MAKYYCWPCFGKQILRWIRHAILEPIDAGRCVRVEPSTDYECRICSSAQATIRTE